MALIIKSSNRLETVPGAPEPIYQARILSILQPNHPLFHFNVIRMDTRKTIDFNISLRYAPEKGFLTGTFAGFWFDRARANQDAFSVSRQMKAFEQYVFKCLARFISDVINRDSRAERESIPMLNDGIHIGSVNSYVSRLSKGFDIFTTYSGQKQGVLHLILDPGEYPILPIDVGGFNLVELNENIRSFAEKHGPIATDKRLKEFLLNCFTDGLYAAKRRVA